MYKLTLLLTIFVFFSCHSSTNQKSLNKDHKPFDWLLGKWERTNEEKGKSTFENWAKINPTEYEGIGFTLQNGDTIKQEKMRIIQQNNKWHLLVKVPGESHATTFPITEIKNNEFTCTNDTLDFPKIIKYWKSGEQINALVAGGSLKIDFAFQAIKK